MIKYELIRSNRRTCSLSVTGDGRVIVRAPYSLKTEKIEEFVLKHISWIKKKQSLAVPQPKLCDGSDLFLFGSRYQIRTGKRSLRDGVLYLPQEKREENLKLLLKEFSLEVMQIVTERISLKYGFHYQRVRISSARGRWGSCNQDGTIAYSFRIAFLPPKICEYIAVHELCHTVHFDHSPAFWKTVERIIPDYKERRKTLKESGAMSFL